MIRFLADASLHHAIVSGCLRREPTLDFLSANDANLEGMADAEVLARAAGLLAEFSRGLDGRVSLIPLNPGPVQSQRGPPLDRCRAVQKQPADAGVRTLLRMPNGQQVGGACGQLAGARRIGRSA